MGRLDFPDPLRPTTTLCFGEKGSIWVWSLSIEMLMLKHALLSVSWLTGLEPLDRKRFDVHASVPRADALRDVTRSVTRPVTKQPLCHEPTSSV